MEFLNTTKMIAGYAMGMRPDGRELLVVVVKGTFSIPCQGEEPQLLREQAPLVMTDVFTGEPGFSAPLYENDFALHKPKCDVLLNGSAYAPDGKPVERVKVALRVGPLQKSFDVVGKRVWTGGPLLGWSASRPEPFTVMPISYNTAFGGIDKTHPNQHHWFLANHAGIGYYHRGSGGEIGGKPLPNSEESGSRVAKPDGNYQPMSFGSVGRAWKPRVKYAGTYDKKWLENVFPLLPSDFRDEYYQAAPADQWTDYPQGGDEVELLNLTPQGRTTFQLPAMPAPLEFLRHNGDVVSMSGKIDTVLLEPDKGRFMMTSRCTLPLKKNIHEMRRLIVAAVPRLVLAKQRFKSLDEMVAAAKKRTWEGG